jgi:hypothetical protein
MAYISLPNMRWQATYFLSSVLINASGGVSYSYMVTQKFIPLGTEVVGTPSVLKYKMF